MALSTRYETVYKQHVIFVVSHYVAIFFIKNSTFYVIL